MNEPILEIVLNGTNAAVQAGQISQIDAEQLNREATLAAAIEIDRAISDCEASAAQYE